MHRITYALLVLTMFAAACSKEQPVTPKPERVKTDSQRVEESLLETASVIEKFEFNSLSDMVEFYNYHKEEHISVFNTTISVIYNGFSIVSAKMYTLPAVNRHIYEFTLGERVSFNFNPAIPVLDLYRFLYPDEDIDEEEARATIGRFNDTYDVSFSLDGLNMGVMRMKALYVDGKMTPAFVMNYNDGASCYLQPEIFIPVQSAF